MIHRDLSMPELGLIAGTRMMLGAGIGLLLADHMRPEHRRAVGWTLLGVGLASTIPLAADVLMHHKIPGAENGRHAAGALSGEDSMTSPRSTF